MAEHVYVYAPAHPVMRAGSAEDSGPEDRQVEFEVRADENGQRFLPVFSTLDRLIDALGPAQPWALLPLRAARALMGLAEVPRLVLDPPATADAWRWRESDLVDYADAVRSTR